MSSAPGIGSWIERRAALTPEAPAIVHGANTTTYARLADRVRRLANGLRTVGVRAGDRVGWLGANHPAFLELLFATAQIDAVLAPVNHRLDHPVIGTLLERYGAQVVFTERAAEGVPLPSCVGTRVGISDGRQDAIDYESFVASSRDDAPGEEVSFDDLCLMPHTSGTTGSPKGVMLTHANVTWNVFNLLSVADIRGDDVTIAIAPFFRAGGTGVNVLPVLFKGGTIVVPQSGEPAEILGLIEQHRVTIGFGNPDLLDALARSPTWATTDLSSIRFFIIGGAPVLERLIATYQARGVTFLQGYGLSEASPLALLVDTPSALRKIGAAGRPLLFVDVRTVRSDGSEAAASETGELLVHGPNVMAGYWDDPDATREALDEGGWLHTGDAARIDADGDAWIVGRMADAYEVSGHVVHPGDVERVLAKHPTVIDAAVVERDGRATAFVVPASDAVLEDDALMAHCRELLPAYAVPTLVVTVASLPRSSVGKLLREDLRAST